MRMQQKGVFKTIILPKYELDERLGVYIEVNKPPPSIYVGLGYDHPDTREVLSKIPQDASEEETAKFQKHYRRIYNDELENDKEIFTRDTFVEFDVLRGAAPAKKGLFSMFSKAPPAATKVGMELKKVGWFKGLINIYNPPDFFQYNSVKQRQYNQLS